MTKYKECKGSVSDSATSCPHCGVSNPGGVQHHRGQPKEDRLGRRDDVYILIDGQDVVTLGIGRTLSVPVIAGAQRPEPRMSGALQ
ncbi:MAG: hypothetical protein IT193_09325 [Propionibacteriaceae bacterium]|nr:hypothetical protein [Propionibacteriaceae bacterium]